ncbi:hypothetical protein BO83DRAFT_382423 [Aspergillus eucalypticola CBS 122712]|uniref:Uncharacterized protein n=1 Tax=Aspergillus eucalypticola (strain CBS 122712 / IBT 29274) TaxID=1448314 RepID=A0A317UPB9_ASPEC|nr:uncharacterized protein BO83DRAFT_382423 [Aspergillus eucalypticola CBS 122712]PWY63833.1 hypothetical protein BO83DRAFT_382423 [Aspergillus eucalypticola CBS 122712]
MLHPKLPNFSLDLAGVVAIADLSTVSQRTVITGTAALLDCLILCPGLHLQQHASDLNKGEYPAAAAMTSGYVFRIENPATVHYLQKISKTAHLTTVEVVNIDNHMSWAERAANVLFITANANIISVLTYAIAASLTIAVLVCLILMKDWWGLFVILIMILARALNVVLIRLRSQMNWIDARSRLDWIGASETGRSDLLVLLSQDRWVRIQGAIDDVKAVTAGQWLREMEPYESWVAAIATVLTYLDAAFASNATQFGKLLLILLLIVSAGLLAVANQFTTILQMHGNVLEVKRRSDKYGRRLDMASELIAEHGGKRGWALRLGLINSEDYFDSDVESRGCSASSATASGSQGAVRRKAGTVEGIHAVTM